MDDRHLSTHGSRSAVPAIGRDTAAPADEPTLHAVLETGIRVLRRRLKLAIAVFLLFTVPAAVFILRRPFTFQATAKIVVERSEEATVVSDEPATGDSAADELRTQSQLLRTRQVVAKTIERLKLWEVPEFAPAVPVRDAAGAQKAVSELIAPFLNRLTVWQEPGTHVLNVTFAAFDAATSSRAVNTLIQVYIDEQMKEQFAASAEVVDWLKARVDEQKARLEESEGALQAYMETENAVSVQERQNIVVQKLADLNTAVTKAKTDRMGKEALYNQLQSTDDASRAVESVPVVLSNPVLQRLRAELGELRQKELVVAQDLGELHPDLITLRSEITATEDRLRAELAKVVQSVRNEFVAAQALEESMVAALEQQKREVLELNRKSLEYGALQRQATSDREIYARLLSESQARGIAGKTPATKIRIIESAEVPSVPVGPKRERDLLLALCGGLLLALSAPLFRESLDHHVKTPAEIERRLGLCCLAIVPKAPRAPSAPGPLLTTEATPFNEAFRRLRTALTIAAPSQRPVRLVVTSAAPQEGKTLVSVNLAMALARLNERVLLIDCDLRRPQAHAMLGVSPRPGLSDLLAGEASAAAVIGPTSVPNLFVVPCGAEHPDATELLASSRLDAVLRQLHDDFRWMVLDSPPVCPVADATVIAQHAHRAVLVVAADSTPVPAARAAVDQLRTAGVSLIGAILNRADLARAGDYYAPYYTREYSAYYATRPAERSPTQAPASREGVDEPVIVSGRVRVLSRHRWTSPS